MLGLVYSQQTAQFYGGEQARAKVEDHTLGFYQALIEARIPFEMVHDGLLDPEHIGRFRTLILPNIAALVPYILLMVVLLVAPRGIGRGRVLN